MNYGIDALALAKYKGVIIRYMPKGFGLGVFALVDGFGDGLAALQEVLAKRPDIPFVRVQLMWRDDHNFTSRDYPFVKKQVERLLPIVQRNLYCNWYVSPCCEHRLNEVEWRKFAGITSTALASVPFHLVNSPEKPKRFSNVINEYHHASGGDAYSYDGANAFDSDVEKDKAAYKDTPYFMFWIPQCNGRKTVTDATKRPLRKAYPIREQIESIAAISRPKGAVKIPAKWIFKSHADQHTDKPSGKDCKPVWIALTKATEIVVKVGSKVIDKARYYGTFAGGGYRYYHTDWGYKLARKAGDKVCDVYIRNKKVGTIDLPFRGGVFR